MSRLPFPPQARKFRLSQERALCLCLLAAPFSLHHGSEVSRQGRKGSPWQLHYTLSKLTLSQALIPPQLPATFFSSAALSSDLVRPLLSSTTLPPAAGRPHKVLGDACKEAGATRRQPLADGIADRLRAENAQAAFRHLAQEVWLLGNANGCWPVVNRDHLAQQLVDLVLLCRRPAAWSKSRSRTASRPIACR